MRYLIIGLLVLPGLALADTVVFNNGSRLEGIATVRGETLEVRVPEGSFYFARALVKSITPAATPLTAYETRKAALPPKDAKAAFELGVFCEANGLKAQAAEMFGRTAALEPDHAGARERLGHRKVGSRWMTREELLADLGLVQVSGEWMSPRAARQMAELEDRTGRLETRLAQFEIEASKLQAAVERSREREDAESERRIAQLEGEVRGLRTAASQVPGHGYYGYSYPYTIVSPVPVYDGRSRATERPYPPRVGRLPFDPLPFPGIPPVGSNR